MGKKPFLSTSSFPQSRGGASRAPAAAFAGGPGHGGGPGQGGKEGGPTGGRIPSLIRAEEVRGGGATVASGSGRRRAWGGATERGGGREVRENGEGIEEVRLPYLAWARAQRGGVLRDGRRSGAAAMAGGGARRSGRRRAVLLAGWGSRGAAWGHFIGGVGRWRRGCVGGDPADLAAGLNGGGGRLSAGRQRQSELEQ